MTNKEIETAQRMRRDGLSYAQIGKKLRYSEETIRCWLNPDAAEKHRQRGRKQCQTDKWKNYDRLPKNRKRKREERAKWYTDNTHLAVTYFIQCPSRPSLVTVGTTVNLDSRMRIYNKCPIPLQVLALTPVPERAIHQYFSRERIHGEVFRYSKAMKKFVESECVMPQAGTLWDKE